MLRKRIPVLVLTGPRPSRSPKRLGGRPLRSKPDLGPLREYAAMTCRFLLERLLSADTVVIRKRRQV